MILIVDMNYKKGSLGFYETVLPIVSIIKRKDVYEIKHYKEITKEKLSRYDKVILSGTTLKDVRFLDYLKCFEWIRDCNLPILGICAGMQVIGLIFGSEPVKCQEIGMGEVETVKDNILFSSKFKAYKLHNFAIRPSEDFDVLAKSENCVQAIKHKTMDIYGVLFHPEVRNMKIIENFLRI